MRYLFLALLLAPLSAQSIDVAIHFDRPLRKWDGFGVNYVEVPQTRDYKANPQDYGGLSVLTPERRQALFNDIFGDDGLQPGLVKMFLDPWHQPQPAAAFDHASTTRWMRQFVREGLQRTRARGHDLRIVTTLYGPPAWATKQRFLRGRDLDPAQAENLALYLIDWVKWLRTSEQIRVDYISLHNEGEDFERWPVDGKSPGHPTHDYNLYWPPKQVTDFMKLLRPMLDRANLRDVGIAPGEPTNWWRFLTWGYATAIWADDEALASMALITSHGFTGGAERWYGGHSSEGVALLRQKRPDLPAWTTSMTWGRMNAAFVNDIRGQIYDVGVNGVIPWATVQTSKWVGGDPNPGTAFRVIEECQCYQKLPGYYFFKQVSRAGQPGMSVASVDEGSGKVRLIAFSSSGSRHPDAFVLINASSDPRSARVRIAGSNAQRFAAYRTSLSEEYAALPVISLQNGLLTYEAPGNSVTTFFAK